MNDNIKRRLFKTLKDISLDILHNNTSTNDFYDVNDVFLLAETIEYIEDVRDILEENLNRIRKEKRLQNENKER